ncbi:MAG: hypothetical protein WC975_06330 [Phycisphaerae bacterium]
MSPKNLLLYIFATPQRKDDVLHIRAWFLFYALYMIAVCILSNWGYVHYSRTGDNIAKAVWFLGLFVFYFSLACTYIPLPTVWLILLLASPVCGLAILTPFWWVVMVAGLGAFATSISHTNEYHFITYLLRLGKIHLLKQTRIYLWAHKQFKVWPFLLLVVFNVLPVPADPVRWLAIISGYPLVKFFLANWIGRFFRYGILAVIAESLKLNLIHIIIISAALIVLSLAGVVFQHIRTGTATASSTP